MTPKSLDLNVDFITALSLMENEDKSIFLTGKAGTGKSTLLSYFRETTEKKIVVLAPTGIAALNVKGETIHSFFKFKPNVTIQSAKKRAQSWRHNHLLDAIDAIVIDEISMVRADLLDCIDVFLQTALENELPFGGKQLIMIGDLHQLPPVVKGEERLYFEQVYESPYFFSAHACLSPDFAMHVIHLNKIYRQEDEQFIDILNGIRANEVSSAQLALLNTRVDPTFKEVTNGHIFLTTTNANADRINEGKLAGLATDLFKLPAMSEGDFDPRQSPTERNLNLKVGAQIMFLNNDANGRWVNGTLGEVEEIDEFEEEILVKTADKKTVSVSPHKWTLYKYTFNESSGRLEQESAGTFRQYPLKLAWAITIHKSQGKTFDAVVIDLGNGAFASGQVYVAFSRCRSLDGLILKAPLTAQQIRLDHRVTRFVGEDYQNWWLYFK